MRPGWERHAWRSPRRARHAEMTPRTGLGRRLAERYRRTAVFEGNQVCGVWSRSTSTSPSVRGMFLSRRRNVPRSGSTQLNRGAVTDALGAGTDGSEPSGALGEGLTAVARLPEASRQRSHGSRRGAPLGPHGEEDGPDGPWTGTDQFGTLLCTERSRCPRRLPAAIGAKQFKFWPTGLSGLGSLGSSSGAEATESSGRSFFAGLLAKTGAKPRARERVGAGRLVSSLV